MFKREVGLKFVEKTELALDRIQQATLESVN
jgi:hypothetical protein